MWNPHNFTKKITDETSFGIYDYHIFHMIPYNFYKTLVVKNSKFVCRYENHLKHKYSVNFSEIQNNNKMYLFDLN